MAGRGSRELFGAVFCDPYRALDRLLGARRRARAAARGHGADELGDLLDGPATGRDRGHAAAVAAAGVRAPAGRLPGALRRAAHARARRASAAARHARHRRARPDVDVHPLGPVHAVHAGLQRDRPAGDLAAAVPGRGRSAAGRAARRAPGRRGGAAGARRAARRGAPWAPPRAPVAAERRGWRPPAQPRRARPPSAAGVTPSASASAVPRARSSRPPSARPRPRSRTRAGPRALEQPQRARDERGGHVQERALAAAASAARCARSRCG